MKKKYFYLMMGVVMVFGASMLTACSNDDNEDGRAPPEAGVYEMRLQYGTEDVGPDGGNQCRGGRRTLQVLGAWLRDTDGQCADHFPPRCYWRLPVSVSRQRDVECRHAGENPPDEQDTLKTVFYETLLNDSAKITKDN